MNKSILLCLDCGLESMRVSAADHPSAAGTDLVFRYASWNEIIKFMIW